MKVRIKIELSWYLAQIINIVHQWRFYHGLGYLGGKCHCKSSYSHLLLLYSEETFLSNSHQLRHHHHHQNNIKVEIVPSNQYRELQNLNLKVH